MSFKSMFGTMNISVSGLSAERMRAEVIANNIANASATRTQEGGAYRRKEVVFASLLKEPVYATPEERIRDRMQQRLQPRLANDMNSEIPGSRRLGGVKIAAMVEDLTEMPRVHNPGHPDAEVRVTAPGDSGFAIDEIIQLSAMKDRNQQLEAAGQAPAAFINTGFVTMPNVNLPIEMVNLITATRSYEAGIRSMKSFREMAEQALTLAPPTRG